MDEECSVCGKICDSQGLANHIRLTNGRGHGPTGSMPDTMGEGGSPPAATNGPIHADDIRAYGPEREQELSVQEALDRVVETRGSELRQINSQVATLAERVDELEDIIESINDRVTLTCPKCGHDDPQPMVGNVADAHAEYIGIYNWFCPECQELFNA